MSRGPADHTGLTLKGRIEVGSDADFAVVAPDDEVVPDLVELEVAVPPDTDLAVGVGRRPRHHLKKGTAVTKKYQIKDTKTNDALELAVPTSVSAAMSEVAADMHEGLLALARCGPAGDAVADGRRRDRGVRAAWPTRRGPLGDPSRS